MHVLTGLRGWAALWVFLYHAWIFADHPPLIWQVAGRELVLTPLVSLGGAGVSIFFVLSGFLLALPYAEWLAGLRPRPNTGRYLLRRVARVFPAYYAQLAILVVLAWTLPGLPELSGWRAFGQHMLMLFMSPPLGTTPINSVWWTLPIEFSFYLALPFLAVFLRFERWWWLPLATLTAMWLWRHFMVVWLADLSIQERVIASYQLPGSLDTFGLGMLAALFYTHRARLPVWLTKPWTIELLAALGLIALILAVYWLFGARGKYWADNPIFYGWTPALAFGTSLLIHSGVQGGRLVALLFGNRFMVFAGTVSYSLYLWHHPIVEWLHWLPVVRDLPTYKLPALIALALPCTLLVSALSYAWIERPCIAWARRRT
jgi:peptidoglycan/LPS O-acetylase OafA/YrhL